MQRTATADVLPFGRAPTPRPLLGGRWGRQRREGIDGSGPTPTLETLLETSALPEVPPSESVGRRGWSQLLKSMGGNAGVPLGSENRSVQAGGVGGEPSCLPACQALNQLALGPPEQMRIHLPPWVGYANTLYSHELQG